MASSSIRNAAAPPIVGRERETSDIEASLESARSGQYRVVLLSGEPGIGKSRLLLHAANYARQQGMLVVRGNCYEDAEMVPFSPFVEVLRDLVRQQPRMNESFNRQHIISALAALAPELATGVRERGLGSFSELEQRRRMFDAYGQLLVGASADQPLVLIVDDVHWADEPSAQLLRHLTRALRHSSAAIVCAYRDTDLEQGDPFETVLIDLTREQLARRIVLRRLDIGATAEIVARVLDSRIDLIARSATESIQRESEGVPFFVEELTMHLREEGLMRLDHSGRWELADGAESLVPQSVRGVISRRLARLRPATREILALASVSGRELELNVVCDVAQHRGVADRAAVVEALDEAVDRRLLIERDGTFVFVHEQIREVLYQGLSAIRRRQLHQLTAEAVERQHPDDVSAASRLAHHYSRGDDLDQALHHTIIAAQEAARVHAVNDATRLYGNALEILDLLDRDDADQRRFDILLALDAVLASSGEHSQRTEGIEAMLVLSRRLSMIAAVRALCRAASHALETGRHPESVDYGRRAVELARSLPVEERLVASLALGQALAGRPIGEPSLLFRDPDMMRESALVYRRSLDLAVDMDNTWEQARIAQELGVLGWALLEEGDDDGAETARGWLLRALEGFRASGDRKGEVTSLIALAYRRKVSQSSQVTNARESYVSFLEEIRRLRSAEHRLTRVSERPRMEALALLSIDLYCRTNGWYEVALQRSGQALALAEEARDARVAVMARIGLSEAERALGRLPQAIEYAERALVVVDAPDRVRPNISHYRDAVVHSLAAGYALTGDRERAMQMARDSVERSTVSGPPARLAESLAALAEVAEIVGDRVLASDTAQRALQVATGLAGDIAWDIRAELVLARAALADGDAGLALGHASAAAGRIAQRKLPIVALRVAVDLARGQALLAAGYESDGREALASANQQVTRIAERITDRELRSSFLSHSLIALRVAEAVGDASLTLSPSSITGRNDDVEDLLTRREIEVLRLVASGLPNREIADQLFISEKTVARHLTNIFTKLDVESRTQAAAWAFRQGIA